MSITKFDLASATSEDIKKEIDRLKQLANEYKNEEQAVKILINSFYGAMGNKWLVCFNPDVAEAVTLQGQNLIKHAEKALNHYFTNIWHKDLELHAKLGITDVIQVKKPVTIYGDTDSNYVCWDEVVSSCNWQGDPKELVLKINEYRLAEFLKVAFDRFADNLNTKNYQDFELENISESGIWLAKKKYLLNVVWESGINIDPLSQITFKGVELAQSSTPSFAREKLKELIKFIFTNAGKGSMQLNDIISLLKKYKQEFQIAEPDKISMGRKVNEYSKYILNDTTAFEVASKCPVQIRAAGYYNFLLNQNPKLKQKYELIKSGDKIKFYYAKTKEWKGAAKEEDVFAFIPGSYPIEFAPMMDHDTQFTKTVIDPINRVTVAMGFPEIGGNLYLTTTLF